MARKVVSGDVLATCVRELIKFASFTAQSQTVVSSRDARKAALKQAAIETLEHRRLLAGVVLGNDGTLTVSGADGQSNNLSVTVSGSSYVAKANSISKTISSSSISKIEIYGGNWADTIKVDTAVTKPSLI